MSDYTSVHFNFRGVIIIFANQEESTFPEETMTNNKPAQAHPLRDKIVKLVNYYDDKCLLYCEEDNRYETLNLKDKEDLMLINELNNVTSIEQLHNTQLFKKHSFLTNNKQIILLPYSPISRSPIKNDPYREKDICRAEIINTFMKSNLKYRSEVVEGLILICSFLAKHVHRYNLGLGISKTRMSAVLDMSIRRLSNLITLLEELDYVRFHTRKSERSGLSLISFVQLTEKFKTQFITQEGRNRTAEVIKDNTIKIDTVEDHFKYVKRLHNLRFDLKQFIWKNKHPIPPVVLEQVFKALG
ncbi:hypothetical protein AB4428_11190 [Vibrio lentus]